MKRTLAALIALAGAAAAHPQLAPRFHEAAAEVGLDFRHFVGATGAFYLPEVMGSGVALFDYDGDGDLDVYLVQGAMLDGQPPARSIFPPPAGFRPGNRLFRNDLIPGGRLRFTDVTAASGAGQQTYGMGAAVGDYDGDGDLDLFVTGFGSAALYRNESGGRFKEMTREAGVGDTGWSSSAAFVDYDRDGDLDLVVLHYLDYTIAGNKKCRTPTGEPDYCTPAAYRPLPARLLRNEGTGRFTDVTATSGLGTAFGPGLGITCADFNGDGWPDLYVANDGAANLLWVNRGDGTFEERALLLGAAYSEDGLARAGMGVSSGDFDNDGDEDVVVTNLRREGATLFRNDGKGAFRDGSAESGLGLATFLFTGFGVGWFDYDADGRLDLFVANGAVTILESLRGSPYPFAQRNQLFHNEGAGRKFREVSDLIGPLVEVSRGAAFGDVDGDGALDVVVSNNNGPVRLLLNRAAAGAHWLEVRLEAPGPNRFGIGARVAVERAAGDRLWRTVRSDGSYLSAGPPNAHFGLGAGAEPALVEVVWPDGARERWTGVRLDQRLLLRRGSGSAGR